MSPRPSAILPPENVGDAVLGSISKDAHSSNVVCSLRGFADSIGEVSEGALDPVLLVRREIAVRGHPVAVGLRVTVIGND